MRISALLGIAAIACSCATPTSPTGGPPDKKGPEIVDTEPQTGTVNFEGTSITFHFSEFVERSSLNRAVNIEPDIGAGYQLDWGRESVTLEFDSELPELTTVIVTIGTELRDMNGNEMSSPAKVAVSTGPDIDEGSLVGNVLNAQSGRGEAGTRILLYREPVDLAEKANYIAGTDTSGSFRFDYLRQGRYKAFWVDDRNRNKIWDRDRERAQPFPFEFTELEKGETDTLGNVFVANSDTSRPVLQGAGLFSSRRMRLRFSEDIRLTDSTRLTISDTLGNTRGRAYPLYIPDQDPFILFAHSENEFEEDSSYQLKVANISDLQHNVSVETSVEFTGSAQEDTTLQRMIRQEQPMGIYPDEAVEIIYAAPIANAALRDSIKVVEGTELRENWPNVSVNRNRLRILPEGTWKSGVDYEIRIWNPLRMSFKKIEPDIWSADNRGAINIMLDDTTDTEPVSAEIRTARRGVMADTTFQIKVEITDLPPVTYRVLMFKDRNGNGKWDHGRVDPYQAPEPYFIQSRVPVRESFTSDLSVSFSYY